ncbi:MAG: hypothetical protein DRO90_03255, partial [Candidatus Altiarchaeales archaeon]
MTEEKPWDIAISTAKTGAITEEHAFAQNAHIIRSLFIFSVILIPSGNGIPISREIGAKRIIELRILSWISSARSEEKILG